MKVKPVRLVVRPHQPLRQFALGSIGVLLLVFAGFILLDYGHWQFIYDQMANSAQQKGFGLKLWDSHDAKPDYGTLRERVTILERAAQIDKEAYVKMQAHVRELQDQIFELKEELEFYRGVVASAKNENGLHIQGLRLNSQGETGRYHYKLVLTNVVKDDKVSSGSVSAEITGTLDGAVKKLDLAALANPGAEELSFSFKHFHRLEGDLVIPRGFKPESVRVVLREEGEQDIREEKVYEWDQLVN